MVALLLVTHGDLANALVGSAKLIMGEAPLVESYGLYHGDDIDALKIQSRTQSSDWKSSQEEMEYWF